MPKIKHFQMQNTCNWSFDALIINLSIKSILHYHEMVNSNMWKLKLLEYRIENKLKSKSSHYSNTVNTFE